MRIKLLYNVTRAGNADILLYNVTRAGNADQTII